MTANIALILEYDGTDYHGRQLQSGPPTIQGVLLSALEKVLNVRPVLYASGRTDSGVHALGQVVNFRVESRLQPDELQRALNTTLPRDIVVKRAFRVPDDFHAQFSVTAKMYKYVILNRPVSSPLLRRYVWHIKIPLDLTAMREGAKYLIGKHDFRAFWGGDSNDSRNPVRTIESLNISQQGEMIEIRVKADGFLRYMVRTIAGTLVEVGKKKLAPSEVREILLSRDRKEAGPTAPPTGLFLVEVIY
jgi:tRNA pseudouridine38-40 synthase